MSGNVWEWCFDWWTETRTYRVIRGGSWNDSAFIARSAYRKYDSPKNRNFGLWYRGWGKYDCAMKVSAGGGVFLSEF